jgi:hypothetical protein
LARVPIQAGATAKTMAVRIESNNAKPRTGREGEAVMGT